MGKNVLNTLKNIADILRINYTTVQDKLMKNIILKKPLYRKTGETVNELLTKEKRLDFLKLDPVERILRMESLLYEIIALKAEEEGVTEGEIYQRYLDRDKKRRHTI